MTEKTAPERVQLMARVDPRLKRQVAATAALHDMALQDFVVLCLEQTLALMAEQGHQVAEKPLV